MVFWCKHYLHIFSCWLTQLWDVRLLHSTTRWVKDGICLLTALHHTGHMQLLGSKARGESGLVWESQERTMILLQLPHMDSLHRNKRDCILLYLLLLSANFPFKWGTVSFYLRSHDSLVNCSPGERQHHTASSPYVHGPSRAEVPMSPTSPLLHCGNTCASAGTFYERYWLIIVIKPEIYPAAPVVSLPSVLKQHIPSLQESCFHLQ